MEVWLDGQFVPRDEARISAFDAGFQHAVGLFETMLARNGRVFRPHRHLERLADSARALLLSERLRVEPLIAAVQATVDRNGLDEARVRLTLTGGDLNMLQREHAAPQDPTVLIVAQPPTRYPEAFFEKGIRAVVAEARANPFSETAGRKTLAYWERIRSLQVAAAQGAGEVLWLTITNHLASGAVSNLFLLKDGVLLTPIARGEEVAGAIPSAVLPGITRATVIECAEAAGIEVRRRLVGIEDLLGADEAFLTNSSWGVLPLVGLEAADIGEGSVGAATRMLREAWLNLVEEETAIGAAEGS